MSSTFFEEVYEVVRKIPKGRVSSYGAIARYLGSNSPRSIGWALNKCEGIEPFVPAHRVLNRNGVLTGKRFFGDINAMAAYLEKEGTVVVDDKVVDFQARYWDPSTEL